jgi:hypothetical protein
MKIYADDGRNDLVDSEIHVGFFFRFPVRPANTTPSSQRFVARIINEAQT